jgi:hypothetical protein
MFPGPLQPRLLQSEVPLRRLIRVVDQHQSRMKPQSLRLLDHRLLILPHKPRSKESSNRSYKWHMVKNIPSGHYVNPARRSRHRSNRRQTRKPLLPSANRLVPPIRQHKIDRRRNRLTINAEQLIRSRVRTGSMRRHPKPCVSPIIFIVVQRLEVLRLLVNTRPAPPPPGLVHKRPMRRIHQPDNPVVHIARQIRLQVRTPKPRRKLRHRRHRRQRLQHLHSPRSRLRQINPGKPIALFTGKRPRINLRRVQCFMARQRRNLHALTAARLKLPPVVLASHRLPIEPPGRQRYSPMRTKIPHRKQLPASLPPQQQRNPQQQRLRRLSLAQLPGAQSRIPIPKDQLRRRSYDVHKLAQPHRVTPKK